MAGGKARKSPESAAVADHDVGFRTDFGQRLSWVLDGFVSRAEASEVAGVVPDQLAKYVRGVAKPPFEVIVRLAMARGVSLHWLADGVGPMMAAPPAPPEDWVMVPVYRVEASSGHGAFSTGEEEREPLAFRRLLLRRLASGGIDKLAIVFNRGISNEPDIYDGDAMLVDRAIERIKDDAFYVFGQDDALLVKMIERKVDGRVALKARNPEYSEEILSREDAARLNVFGRVVWRGGLV